MSRKLFVVLVLLGAIFVTQCGEKENAVVTPEGKRAQKIVVTFVLGKAIIKSEKASAWDAIKVGRLIELNDAIKVDKKGRVVLQSETGSVITVKDASDLKISSLFNPKNGEEETLIALNSGKTVINPRKLTGKSSFDVKTPAMVAGVRGTVFTVEHTGGSSRVAVKEGQVAVKPKMANEELSETINPVNVTVGQKTELSESSAQEIEKNIVAKMEKKESATDAKVDAAVNSEIQKEVKEVLAVEELKSAEKVVMEQDSKELLRLDIDLKKEDIVSNENKKEEAILGALSVSSYGNAIFINGAKMANDYYSSLFPEGQEVDIQVKKGDEIIMQKKVKVTRDGVNLDMTSEEQKTKEIEKLNQGITAEPFKILAEGFKFEADSMQKSAGLLAFQNQNSVRLGSLENPSKLVTLGNNPKVRPLIAGGLIFTSDMQGNLIVSDLSGNKKGQVSLGQKIAIPSSIAYADGKAFLANSYGKIVGIDSEGKTVVNMQIPGEILSGSPMAVSKDKVVAFSPVSFNAYVIAGNKVEKQFRLNGRISYRPAIISGKLVLPEGNNISIRDLSGQVVATIQAAPADIKAVSGNSFAVLYGNKTVFYNLQGKELSQLPTSVLMIQEGKLVYGIGKTAFMSEGNQSQNVVLPEKIQALTLEQGKVVALSESGKIYQLDF